MNSFFGKVALASYDFNESSGLNNAASKMGYNKGQSFSPENIISEGISYALSFLGVIFLVLAIYAGITWMTSQGNEKAIEKAKNILTNSIIGLVIVALAYVISYLVISNFTGDYLN